MERRSAHRQYRCEATMRDGSAGVLFASCSTPAMHGELAYGMTNLDTSQIQVAAAAQDPDNVREVVRSE